MPTGIANRPRDNRGFPITFVTLMDSNGRPDFTTIAADKIVRCIKEARCGMCGNHWPGPDLGPEDHLMAFIGGPVSCENQNFLDPPMHVECAEYAMRVCPHIAIPTARYAKQTLGGPEQRELYPDVSSERPEKFGLYVTDSCQVVPYNGQPVFLASAPIRLTWQEDL